MSEVRRLRLCPICRKRPLAEGQRFCSDRCAQIDLGRWLSGSYAIPAEEEEPSDSEEKG